MQPMREITYSQAINEAIAEEMRRDPAIVILGEDVAEAGTPFKVLAGLVDEFGTERVIDTPISEPGFTGIGVGAAMSGLRPVVDLMFGDFLFLVMDQLCNHAAKAHYMSGGKLRVPMVVRTNMGGRRRAAAQHSQSLHALAAHVPGLKVALPATPHVAKAVWKAALRDPGPVVIFEHKLLYQQKGRVPEGEVAPLPLGQARVCRPGRDVTLVALSSFVQLAEEAADRLAEEGISAEVIDPVTLVPLDRETILASVRRTGRAVVLDEGHRGFGASAELAALIAEACFYHLDAPVRRLAALDVPAPFSPVLEDLTQPGVADVLATVREMLGRESVGREGPGREGPGRGGDGA